MDYKSAYTEISNIFIKYNQHIFDYSDNEGSNCNNIVLNVFNILLLILSKRKCIDIIVYDSWSNNVYAQEEITTLVLQCSKDLLDLIHTKYNLTQIKFTIKGDIIYLYYPEVEHIIKDCENVNIVDFPFSERVRLPVSEGVSYILEGEDLVWFNMQCTTFNIITVQSIFLEYRAIAETLKLLLIVKIIL